MNVWMLLRLLVTLGMVSGLALTARWLLKRTYPQAWSRWLRFLFLAALVCLVAGIASSVGGLVTDSSIAVFLGVHAVGATLVTTLLLVATGPIWAGMPALFRWRAASADKPVRREPADLDSPERRFFLGLATVPAAAAATGPIGAVASMLTPHLRRVDIPAVDLPAGLDGLKILQLTDVHLGTFIDVDQVTAAVELSRGEQPDLVVLTGDIADDYGKLAPSLEKIESLGPKLGCFAIYGNHEVYRGRAACAKIYARSAVRLLRSEGVLLRHNGEPLWLGGADDPARLGRNPRPFLAETVRRSFVGCPDNVKTRILLSHRPEGFEQAARQGVTLTLAGHTHGAQAAVCGRSWLEWLLPNSYMLGLYRNGPSYLYTSAGLGHWLPFRLNCPCEVALVTLRRAAA